MTDTSKRPSVHDILQDYTRLRRVEKLAGELAQSVLYGEHYEYDCLKARELQEAIQKGVK